MPKKKRKKQTLFFLYGNQLSSHVTTTHTHLYSHTQHILTHVNTYVYSSKDSEHQEMNESMKFICQRKTLNFTSSVLYHKCNKNEM